MSQKSFRFYLKGIAILLLKIAVSIFLVRIAVKKVDLHELGEVFRTIHISDAFLILFFIAINWIIQIFRWQTVLKNNAVSVRFSEAAKSYFIGYTFRLLIPGGFAEFLKIYYLNGRRQQSFIAFCIESFLMALIHLALMCLAGCFLFPTYRIYLIFFAAAVLVILIILPFAKKIPFVIKYIPADNFRFRLTGRIILLTIVSLIVINCQYHFVLNIYAPVGWLDCAAAVIFIIGAGSVPFTFSGLGVRENLAIYLLGMFGVKSSIAMAVSFFIFTTNIVLPALLGMVLVILHQTQRHSLPIPRHSISPKA